MFYANRTNSLVFDQGLMPLAKRTYESHFWNGNQPDILAQHMPGYVAGQAPKQPGRNIANAGIARTGGLAAAVGDVVQLNGTNSLFPEVFTWSVKLGTTLIPLTNPNSETPSFTPTATGIYTVTLNTALPGNETALTTNSIDIEVVAAQAPVSFRNDILSINDGYNMSAPMRRCAAEGGCHRSGLGKGPDFHFIVGNTSLEQQNEIYRNLRDRSDLDAPLESLFYRKNKTGDAPHAGGIFPYSVDPMIRWILEGAPNN